MALKHRLGELASIKFLDETLQDLDERIGDGGVPGSTQIIMSIPVNVSAGDGTGASAPVNEIEGLEGIDSAQINPIGIVPLSNQDQFVDNVEVEVDTKIRVTLAANATAQNQFLVGIVINML